MTVVLSSRKGIAGAHTSHCYLVHLHLYFVRPSPKTITQDAQSWIIQSKCEKHYFQALHAVWTSELDSSWFVSRYWIRYSVWTSLVDLWTTSISLPTLQVFCIWSNKDFKQSFVTVPSLTPIIKGQFSLLPISENSFVWALHDIQCQVNWISRSSLGWTKLKKELERQLSIVRPLSQLW